MGFQKTINQVLPVALEGDFASANPRASMLVGDSALVTGASGVTVGNFAWATAAGIVTSAWAAACRIGFVHREMQALITTYLAEASLVIPGGLPVTLMTAGDFWDRFAGGAVIGQKVYAYYADGSAYAAATGTPPTNALITANIATSNVLTVTANTGLPIVVGQPVSGAGIAAGAYISALGTGTGGAGTYTMSAAATATTTGITVTATTAVETNFIVASTAAAGELAKTTIQG